MRPTVTTTITGWSIMATVAHAAVGIGLPVCASSPNCVSSQAVDSHHIKPFTSDYDVDLAFQHLKDVLSKRSDTTIVSVADGLIRVEFRTLLGFIDDGLFVLDREKRILHVYSAARSGYWDLGKNRRRIEEIRRSFVTATTR